MVLIHNIQGLLFTDVFLKYNLNISTNDIMFYIFNFANETNRLQTECSITY